MADSYSTAGFVGRDCNMGKGRSIGALVHPRSGVVRSPAMHAAVTMG